jgi:hypothetical protein
MAELKDHIELANTREKLRMLEQQYSEAQARPCANQHARQLTLRSLKKLINQLTEEIVRFESRAKKPTHT